MSKNLKVNYKLWFEKEGKSIIGYGGVKLLEEIKKTGNLQSAIKALGLSYRYAWGYLKKLEQRIGFSVITTYKGGYKGGGGMNITKGGEELIKIYSRINTYILDALNNPTLWETYGLKTSKMNQVIGTVDDVKIGEEVAEVSIMVSEPCRMSSIITRESIEKMKIEVNDMVRVVVKATEITLDKEDKENA